MAILLSLEDFIEGKYNIPDASTGQSDDNVQECIDNFEASYIYKVFGATLGKLIIANIQASGSTYNGVVNAFAEDDTTCGGVYISNGLQEFLKAAIFYEYENNAIINSIAGAVIPDTETSTKLNAGGTLRNAEKLFNDQLETVSAIQWKCLNDSTSTYTDFNGESFTVKAANFI